MTKVIIFDYPNKWKIENEEENKYDDSGLNNLINYFI